MKLVLYGAETYCINNRVRKLIQDIDDMNVSRYQGLSREAVAATSRYPIMADKQAVIVETEKLTGDDTKMLPGYSGNYYFYCCGVRICGNTDKCIQIHDKKERSRRIWQSGRTRA